jgi:hypothetical protein
VRALSVFPFGGAEERKEHDGDAAATFAHAVALQSTTAVSLRNKDSLSSSTEPSFKTEEVSTRT